MSKLGREISILLMRSEEWVYDDYRLEHLPTGIQLWVANGPFFLDVYNKERIHAFGPIERQWLWFTQVHSLVKKLKPKKPTKEQKVAKVLAIIEKSKISS